MKLKETLDNLKIRIFANPIHYYGEYYPNRTRIMKESDNKCLKHYAFLARMTSLTNRKDMMI